VPQSDYNVIASGSNGYSANPGYNLVTGLGTPVANLLVPDLVAYQGPGTSYPGAAVGPLQDANLANTGASAGGPINVFSVFDSLTITSNGLGCPRDQSISTDFNSPLLARLSTCEWVSRECQIQHEQLKLGGGTERIETSVRLHLFEIHEPGRTRPA